MKRIFYSDFCSFVFSLKDLPDFFQDLRQLVICHRKPWGELDILDDELVQATTVLSLF